jgi:hypothetical protein
MSRTTALKILKTLSFITEPHPLATPGNMHDFKRANDKHKGAKVCHYWIKSVLYYVASDK